MSSKNENYKNYRILPDINDPVYSQYQFVYDPISGEFRENDPVKATEPTDEKLTNAEVEEIFEGYKEKLRPVHDFIDEETKAKIDKKLDALHKWQEQWKVTEVIAESEALYEQEEQFGRIEELSAQAPSGQGILAAGLDIIEMLLEKNVAYSNSAMDPLNILSDATPEEQIKMHIDNKLTRLKYQREFQNEDSLKDLAGYVILLMVLKQPQ